MEEILKLVRSHKKFLKLLDSKIKLKQIKKDEDSKESLSDQEQTEEDENSRESSLFENDSNESLKLNPEQSEEEEDLPLEQEDVENSDELNTATIPYIYDDEYINHRLQYLDELKSSLEEKKLYVEYYDEYSEEHVSYFGHEVNKFNTLLLHYSKGLAVEITIENANPSMFDVIDIISDNNICRSLYISCTILEPLFLISQEFVDALNSSPSLSFVEVYPAKNHKWTDDVDQEAVSEYLSGKLHINRDLVFIWDELNIFIKEKGRSNVLTIHTENLLESVNEDTGECITIDDPDDFDDEETDENGEYYTLGTDGLGYHFKFSAPVYKNKLTKEKFQQQLESKGTFSIELLYRGIASGVVKINNDLPYSRDCSHININNIDINHEYDGWRLIDYAAKHGYTLLIREFHRLGKINLSELNSYYSSSMEIAIEHSTPDTIMDLLDLPELPIDIKSIDIGYENRNFLNKKLHTGDTFLISAVKLDRRDNLELLLKLGADPNQVSILKKTAADWALEKQSYGCLIILLENGAKFPADSNGYKENIIELYNKRLEIIQALKEGDLSKVEEMLRTERLTHSFLSIENESAPYIAFVNNKFEIYAMLRSRGFALLDSEKSSINVDVLRDSEISLLRQAMIAFTNKHAYSSINYLMSRTKIFQLGNDLFEQVLSTYKTLSNIPEVLAIFEVLEYSNAPLDIIYDFEKDNVEEISGGLGSTKAAGVCQFKAGYIFIGGKVDTRELLGTIAHELTHQAIYLLYKNDCKPFDKSDSNAINKLSSARDQAYYFSKDPIVTRVFTAYKDTDHDAEIIVRVPHILAKYGYKNGHEPLENEAPLLIQFYQNFIVTKSKEFVEQVRNRGLTGDVSLETKMVLSDYSKESTSFKKLYLSYDDLFYLGALIGNFIISPTIQYLDDKVTGHNEEKRFSEYYTSNLNTQTFVRSVVFSTVLYITPDYFSIANKMLISKVSSDLVTYGMNLPSNYALSTLSYIANSFATFYIIGQHRHIDYESQLYKKHSFIIGAVAATSTDLLKLAHDIYDCFIGQSSQISILEE